MGEQFNLEAIKSICDKVDGCNNEESTKMFMIMPFLQVLGYNVFNPDEVQPEHHADFSDTHKNRIDMVIKKNAVPSIGIEVKAVGSQLSKHRGQLKSYFNAVPTIKLGILTNGLEYECFADTDEPNIMDSEPYLTFDLRKLADGTLDETTIQGIASLKKDQFDPENLGATARKKIMHADFVKRLDVWSVNPDDEITRLFLLSSGFQGRITSKVIEESTPIVSEAFDTFINKKILRRVGISEDTLSQSPIPTPSEAEYSEANFSDGIITTEDELYAYDYAVTRLAFLSDNEEQYGAISELNYLDMKSTFKVFYKKINAGSIFNYTKRKDGTMVFTFPALDNMVVSCADIQEIDEPLFQSFKKRLETS